MPFGPESASVLSAHSNLGQRNRQCANPSRGKIADEDLEFNSFFRNLYFSAVRNALLKRGGIRRGAEIESHRLGQYISRSGSIRRHKASYKFGLALPSPFAKVKAQAGDVERECQVQAIPQALNGR